MRERRRGALAWGMAATVALALTGCGLVGNADITDVQLHPEGPQGAWFDAGFAAGVVEGWSAPGHPCGSAGDVIVLGDWYAGTATGYHARSGEQMWQVENTLCRTDSFRDGHLLLAQRSLEGGVTYVDVDVASGDQVPFYEPVSAPADAAAVGRTADRIYLMVTKAGRVDNLMAFDLEGELQWQRRMDDSYDCHVIVDHLVCATVGNQITVLDAATGTVTVPATQLGAVEEVIWTTGGYTVIDLSDSIGTGTTAVYDYTGAQIGEVEGADQPIYPGLDEGVRYPVEDLSVDRVAFVRMTDADGRVVAHWDGGIRLTQYDVPVSSSPIAAATDGSGLLLRAYATDTVELVLPDGEIVHTFEDVGLIDLEVHAGVITLETGSGSESATTVYLPAD